MYSVFLYELSEWFHKRRNLWQDDWDRLMPFCKPQRQDESGHWGRAWWHQKLRNHHGVQDDLQSCRSSSIIWKTWEEPEERRRTWNSAPRNCIQHNGNSTRPKTWLLQQAKKKQEDVEDKKIEEVEMTMKRLRILSRFPIEGNFFNFSN